MIRGPGKRAVKPSSKVAASAEVVLEPAAKAPRTQSKKKGDACKQNSAIAEKATVSVISGTFSMLQKAELCHRALQCSKHKEYWQQKATRLATISDILQSRAVDHLEDEDRELWLQWTTGTTRKAASGGTGRIVGAHSSWYCWPRNADNCMLSFNLLS